MSDLPSRLERLLESAPAGHTPGPLEVLEASGGGAAYVCATYGCINGLGALFTLARVSAPDDSEIGYTDGAYDAEVADANARLFALAPELLSLLRELVPVLREAEEALRPFAIIAAEPDRYRHADDDTCIWRIWPRDLHRARAAHATLTGGRNA